MQKRKKKWIDISLKKRERNKKKRRKKKEEKNRGRRRGKKNHVTPSSLVFNTGSPIKVDDLTRWRSFFWFYRFGVVFSSISIFWIQFGFGCTEINSWCRGIARIEQLIQFCIYLIFRVFCCCISSGNSIKKFFALLLFRKRVEVTLQYFPRFLFVKSLLYLNCQSRDVSLMRTHLCARVTSRVRLIKTLFELTFVHSNF